jgi:hypothetical protein
MKLKCLLHYRGTSCAPWLWRANVPLKMNVNMSMDGNALIVKGHAFIHIILKSMLVGG